MRMSYGRPQEPKSFIELLDDIPDAEFERTTRSTVPLLAWWRSPQHHALLAELLRLPALPEAEAWFEYAVPSSCRQCPERGRGKSSFTDLMLDVGSDVVAIEAKNTEPLYETVGR